MSNADSESSTGFLILRWIQGNGGEIQEDWEWVAGTRDDAEKEARYESDNYGRTAYAIVPCPTIPQKQSTRHE